MKIFMLGWEFPPFISGGLGTACYGLTKAMSQMGFEVVFVLPRPVETAYSTHVKMLTPHSNPAYALGSAKASVEYENLHNIKVHSIRTLLTPYQSPVQYQQKLEQLIKEKRLGLQDISLSPGLAGTNISTMVFQEQPATHHYGRDMFGEVHRYAAEAVRLALLEDFDVIHAHDWMTYPAGIAVAAVTGKPLVIHVHSTEFDRSGEHVNQPIYDIERRGMHAADRIIAVSHLTRNIIITRYGVYGDKIDVIYNGVDRDGQETIGYEPLGIKSSEKIVLFLGRITMQKGPEYFLMAAKKVLQEVDDVKFVMAGSGDMMHRIIQMAAELGIGQKVLFTGFLHGKDVAKVYKMADLYVMPSVSEPFGIAPLEALNYDVPVIISKQSGVAEVLTHVLKVDFWDVTEMANKIVAVLKYPPLQMTLREHGNFEVRKLKWSDAARKCAKVYEDVLLRV